MKKYMGEIAFTVIGGAILLFLMFQYLDHVSVECQDPHNAKLAFCHSQGANANE